LLLFFLTRIRNIHMAVLTLNAGSSSLKFAVFHGAQALLRGAFENIQDAPRASATKDGGETLDPPEVSGKGHEAVLPALFEWVKQHLGDASLAAVGHRIVHGGDRFTGPALIDIETLRGIEALSPLAPLHQCHNVAAIRASQAAEPGLPQVACFDTAFHRSLPPVARALGLPASLPARRYGFHGLSYEWIASRLSPRLAAGRTVVAHLGNGASLCALRGGVSVETTMGTTPLDGLLMGTRCGSLDPGALLYLMQAKGLSAREMERVLYEEAGLLGVSGVASDMRALHDSAVPAAGAAIELFVYRIVQNIGALAAVLGGIDGLVFTGGIGEHDADIRARVCDRLGWLGVAIDPDASVPGCIGAGGRAEVWVIPTDEEAVIARQTREVCQAQARVHGTAGRWNET
jgi:acetate kinase